MSETRQYIDMLLQLRDPDPATQSFKIAVLPNPAGMLGSVAALSVPMLNEEDRSLLDDLERKNLGIADALRLGKELTKRLLPDGEIRSIYQQALTFAGQDGGVRLRLIIEAPDLAQIPWELAYDPHHMGAENAAYFLALNPKISITRFEERLDPPPKLALMNPHRLTIRVVTSNARVSGQRPLQLDQERRVIEHSLNNFDVDGVQIELKPFVEQASWDDLTRALASKVDLFHFAGHGVLDVRSRDPQTGAPLEAVGQIVLQTSAAEPTPHLVPARDLANLLAAAGARLAVLGACNSGRRDKISPWNAVAPALLEAGLAAVIAMQYLVQDDAAVAFSKSFYTSLAAGLTIDEAVSSGRRAMTKVPSPSPLTDLEWVVPVLYLNSADGVLFPELAERESPTAAAIRIENKMVIDLIAKGSSVIGVEADLKEASGQVDISSDIQAKEVSGNLTGVKLGFGRHPKPSPPSEEPESGEGK